jgi:hypothetical protein
MGSKQLSYYYSPATGPVRLSQDDLGFGSHSNAGTVVGDDGKAAIRAGAEVVPHGRFMTSSPDVLPNAFAAGLKLDSTARRLKSKGGLPRIRRAGRKQEEQKNYAAMQ